MYKYSRLLLLLFTALLLLMAGCDDRGRNIPTVTELEGWSVDPTDRVFSTDDGTYAWVNPPDTAEFLMQNLNERAQLAMQVYIPKVATAPLFKPVPTLLLLAPQEGKDSYFRDSEILAIVEEMTATGEIQPMRIVMIGNDDYVGGNFYGNSYGGGFYDRVLGDAMIEKLENNFPGFINDPSKLGIGGVGQGAYGAFRTTIQNPGMYGSVSAVDGPLDFDGSTGSGGFIALLDTLMVEQTALDSTSLSTIERDDVAAGNPVLRMFVGGSIAFSPHDTLLSYFVTAGTGKVTLLGRMQMADSTTLNTSLNPASGQILDLHFHFPFYFSSAAATAPTRHDPTWDRWMANDLDVLKNAAASDPLESVKMWIATTPQTRFGFNDMTRSWIMTLEADGYVAGSDSLQVVTYEGYDDLPAQGSEYMYDLLRQILK
ncbi:MAG: hypothetical protein V3T31_01610, partial [candidate division Zixibacteria bacterium]